MSTEDEIIIQSLITDYLTKKEKVFGQSLRKKFKVVRIIFEKY